MSNKSAYKRKERLDLRRMSLLPKIESMQDIRLLLKQYGTIIYTKDPLADLDLIEEEIQELYGMGMLDHEHYVKAKLLIRQEMRKYKQETGTDDSSQ